MGTQVLGEKKTRMIARNVGRTVLRAWTHGVHDVFAFVTDLHEHGTYNRKTGEVTYHGPDTVMHYASCSELFPPAGDGDLLDFEGYDPHPHYTNGGSIA